MNRFFDTSLVFDPSPSRVHSALWVERLGIPITFRQSTFPHTFSEPWLSHGNEAGTRDAMAKLLVFYGDREVRPELVGAITG
jgi:hypothetical protein